LIREEGSIKPLDEIKATIARYWTERAEAFDSSPSHISQSEAETAAWKEVLTGLTLGQAGLSVLDVGTGTGFLAFLLAEMGQRVTGIDVSAGMLEQARRKASESRLDVAFREADAEDTPFSDDFFDLVISRYVLWNLPNPSRAVAEWKRIVRPGGKVGVIDGVWSRDRGRARLAESGSEDYQRVLEVLPLYGGAPAEEVMAIFADQKLTDIKVRSLDDLITIKRQSLPEEMRDSYSPHRFVVQGTMS
jgi:ubiquinone/menaquinone biosynthesis C-methylase UbiE